MLNSFRPRSNCEIEAKFIQDRIQFTEKHLGELCSMFAQYCRKAARLRDKGDELTKIISNYAEAENINKSLVMGLENFAEAISSISDYGDCRVNTLETKVVGEFSKYDEICRNVKEDVKGIYSAREREMNRKRQLDRIKERNPSRQQIMHAETELVKATAEVSKTIHALEEKTNTFERQKLHDLKSILLDFICTELGYHAKVLEILTKAYKDIDRINEDSDLKDFQKVRGKMELEFKKSLQMPDAAAAHQSPTHKSSLFKSTGSLGSLGGIFSSSQYRKNSTGIKDVKEGLQWRSEETLDSMKHSISDSDNSEDDDTSTNVDSSPVIRRKLSK